MRTYSGITIIELLASLLIVSTLSILVLSNLPSWVASTRLTKDRENFASLIYTARSAAIHLNHPVILCPGDKTNGCARRDSWHDGAIVFADQNRNKRLDAEDAVVAGISSIDSRISWRSFRNRKYLRFLPSGRTDWQNGHFKFCSPDQGRKALQLVLNAAGRVYFSHDDDGDGWHEDVQGRNLIC